MPEFKVGDQVQLKSGGPVMTVIGQPPGLVPGDVQEGKWICSWFSGGKNHNATFPTEALEAARSDGDQPET